MRKMMTKLMGVALAVTLAVSVVTPITAQASDNGYRRMSCKGYDYVNGKAVLHTQEKTTRDAKGNEKKNVHTIYYDYTKNTYSKKPVSTSTTKYTYKKGKLVKVKIVESGAYTTYQYSGNLVKSTKSYDAKGRLQDLTTYTIKKKKVVSSVSEYYDSNGEKSVSVYNYDKKGNIISYKGNRYDKDGKVSSTSTATTKYTYKKNTIKKSVETYVFTYFSSYGDSKYTTTTTSEYNTSGFKKGEIKKRVTVNASTYEPTPVTATYTYSYKADKSKKNVGTQTVKKDGVLHSKYVYTWKKY